MDCAGFRRVVGRAAWSVWLGLGLGAAGCGDDGGIGAGDSSGSTGGSGSTSTPGVSSLTNPGTNPSASGSAMSADTTAGTTGDGATTMMVDTSNATTGGTTMMPDDTTAGTTMMGATTGSSSGGMMASSSGGSSSSSDGGPACGNGVVDAGEQCDGADLQGFDCATLGLGGGVLACDPVMCIFDVSGCMPVGNCGNGVVDPGEQCDGADLQGFDCASLGLGGGVLACDPMMCTFDTSMCMVGGGTSG